ncbi:MAG: T9SS type A sorting domain-containing protein [Saprospiraceae bacterium]|nr:T9SS type A sorting domain-containing protein [Saprospiraceae bacterium]MBK9727815.1 T9SS type A sorting domain-containing protein [Saprospiraceae bacterium]
MGKKLISKSLSSYILKFFIISLSYGIFLNKELVSQAKYTNTWLLGYDGMDFHTRFDFLNDSLSISTFKSTIDIDGVGVMSDFKGNLLFYTNGCKIYNRNHELMQNGNMITPIEWASICTNGLSLACNDCFLTIPSQLIKDKYFLISPNMDKININGVPWVGSSAFYYHIIEFDSSYPDGIVNSKANTLLEGIFDGHGINMCRHGNGRDWWILLPHIDSNCISIFMFRDDRFIFKEKKCFDFNYSFNGGSGTAKFSPDGNYYVISDNYEGVSIFKFDRCIGSIDYLENIKFPEDTIPGSYCEISPNSQFLYVLNRSHCWQIDLTSADRTGSKTLVAAWDGMVPNTRFGGAQLAPDKKIYIACPGTSRFYHVISNPDLKGINCNFIQRAINLPTYNFYTIPSFPNYNLKSDSVNCNLTKIDNIVPVKCRVNLNRMSDNKFLMNFSETLLNSKYLNLFDIAGNLIFTKDISNLSTYEIDLNHLTQGFYIISVTSKDCGVFAYKIIIRS